MTARFEERQESLADLGTVHAGQSIGAPAGDPLQAQAAGGSMP